MAGVPQHEVMPPYTWASCGAGEVGGAAAGAVGVGTGGESSGGWEDGEGGGFRSPGPPTTAAREAWEREREGGFITPSSSSHPPFPSLSSTTLQPAAMSSSAPSCRKSVAGYTLEADLAR